MKKTMKKIFSLGLVSFVSFSVMGCVRGGEKVNEEQTQLYVATFEGGFGTGWMDTLAERFEKKYANVSFEEGKMGVQVIAKPERDLTNEILSVKLLDMQH